MGHACMSTHQSHHVGLCFTRIHKVARKSAHNEHAQQWKWVHFQWFSNPSTLYSTKNLLHGQDMPSRPLFHPNPPSGHEASPLPSWYSKKMGQFSGFFQPLLIFCNHKPSSWAGQASTHQSDPVGLCFTQIHQVVKKLGHFKGGT
jgi:hypothetical protein